MGEERRLPDDEEPDQTRAQEPAGEPAAAEPPAEEPAEEPAPGPEPAGEPADPWAHGDETSVLPPAGDDRWRGQAGVRPGYPPAALPPTGPPPAGALPPEYYAEQPRGRWWAPAAVALIALLLLGVLGFGVWLILNSLDRSPAPPPPSPSPSPTAASPSPAPSPSPTVTRSPTPSPVPMVAVPPVVGLSLADAKEVLDRNELKYEVIERPTAGFPRDRVAAVEPEPGTSVPVGSTVKLYVAVPPPPPPPSPTVSPTGVRPTGTRIR